MGTSNSSPLSPRKPGLRSIGTVLLAAWLGPLMVLALGLIGITIAPPWTLLTGMLYCVLPWLSIPLCLLALRKGRIKGWGWTAALVMSVIGSYLSLAVIGFRLPTGMTDCRPAPAQAPLVRYNCVSTSSDNASYRYEFTLEGWEGWPLMRMVEAKYPLDFWRGSP